MPNNIHRASSPRKRKYDPSIIKLARLHRQKRGELIEKELKLLSLDEINKAIGDLEGCGHKGDVENEDIPNHVHESLLQLLVGAKYIKEAQLRDAKK